MVDLSDKGSTARRAVASGRVVVSPKTIKALNGVNAPKGDVLGVARIAGIMAAKKTAELIPLCHTLRLDSCKIEFTISENAIDIRSEVKVYGPTGVEMEALTAVSVAAVTIYDMCKSIDKNMVITNIMLMEKTGGRTGHFAKYAG